MGFLDILDDRAVFFLLRDVNRILMIDTGHRPVRRNLNDIHSVNITELLLLRQRGTRHTRLLLIFVEEVLEGNRSQRLALSADDLKKRGFGEALYTQLTPEQRQQTLILKDADELGEFIARREEAMAAETMLTNGCIMKHIADDADESDEMEIRFYSEGSNPATYAPTTKWDAAGAKILADLGVMARMLTSKGLRATDLICSPDVADTIVNNEAIQKLLDNKRYELGMVEPEVLPAGAAVMARLNVNGRIISVISYDETYTDDAGKDQLYIPSGKCILTAPACGRTLYGAVTQVEQADGEFHTYAGRRVPKYLSNAEGNTRSLTISSRPLLIPNNKNPFIVADVLTQG